MIFLMSNSLYRFYHRFRLFVFCFILCGCIDGISNIAYAISPELVLRNIKLLTPSIREEQRYIIPQNFSHTNNLRRRTGSPFLAKGRFLYIEGFVLDLMGVPVENAVVRIWQANNFGYYNHLVVNKEDYTKYDVDFEGTGTCITDNNGHYSFFTIIPGYYGDRAPHINFIVEHEDFERLETAMYFSMHLRNAIDNTYINMSQKNRYLVSCKTKKDDNFEHGEKCSFDIRLNGLHRNKRY